MRSDSKWLSCRQLQLYSTVTGRSRKFTLFRLRQLARARALFCIARSYKRAPGATVEAVREPALEKKWPLVLGAAVVVIVAAWAYFHFGLARALTEGDSIVLSDFVNTIGGPGLLLKASR